MENGYITVRQEEKQRILDKQSYLMYTIHCYGQRAYSNFSISFSTL